MLKRTPFYDFHVASGAKMVEFAGWEMPLLYRSIVDEHEQTRRSGSLFDVSHMGRLAFSGRDAQKFLDYVLTRKLADQQVAQSRYSLICNSAGGVLDDVIVSRDTKNWLLVCNASNRDKLLQHFADVRKTRAFEFDLADNTEATAMAAIQGPQVLERLSDAISVELSRIKRYHFENVSLMGIFKFTVYRSGYTGEDGVEIVLPAGMAKMAVGMLAGRGDKEDATVKPAGLGVRDTLRLEAGMPLYGHELSENRDPLAAGLGWAVDLTKDFLGADALRSSTIKQKLVGLKLDGKRIARQGTPIQSAGSVIGEVTSGTFSPTLQKSIAMGYVDAGVASEGTQVQVDLKGTLNPAKIVKLPFYKRAGK